MMRITDIQSFQENPPAEITVKAIVRYRSGGSAPEKEAGVIVSGASTVAVWSPEGARIFASALRAAAEAAETQASKERKISS